MYCTIDDLKERLDITGNQNDAMLDGIIEGVSDWIDLYCKRASGAFAVQADTTRYYDQSAVRDQMLTFDTTVLSVTTLLNGDGATLSANAYRLQPRNQPRYYQIQLLSSYSWSWSTDGEIAVTGKFGYSLLVPTPVREAALQFAGWVFKRWQAALQDASVNFELGEIRYSKKVPETVLALLDQFVDRSKML